MVYDPSTSHRNAKKIKIAAGLEEFPLEILHAAETLEILDLSDNALSFLPTEFARLQHLKVFFCSNNKFGTYPEVLGKLPKLAMVAFKNNGMHNIPEDALGKSLRWLILTNNQLTQLPNSLGNCLNMQKLMLAGNNLEMLPHSMEGLPNLALLRVSGNNIKKLPAWLFRLPELAFLAFAGNPCSRETSTNIHLHEYSEHDLELQETLGEGASGTIYRADCASLGKSVAVKLFKGDMTSDGFPLDEMRACLAAGSHSNLIDTIGRLTHKTMQREGIVLQLISASYTILGQPPSLESCTRDCYADGLVFPSAWILTLLTGIASAALHLHRLGISHGDLYAHNILVNNSGHALLGDFGAATIYSTQHEQRDLIERLEVKAFGHLVEDLASRATLTSDTWKDVDLLELQKSCQQDKVDERPDFASIVAKLRAMHEKVDPL